MSSIDEHLDEELRVMEERSSPGTVISAEVFQQPIEILCTRPARTLDVKARVREALDLMQEERFGSVVVTRDGRMVGIVTERDFLLKVAGHEDDVLEQPITVIMTADPEWLMKTDEIVYLLHKMHVGGFRHVPIVNDRHEPVHVVSIRDVTAFVMDYFPNLVLVQSDPYRGEPKQESG